MELRRKASLLLLLPVLLVSCSTQKVAGPPTGVDDDLTFEEKVEKYYSEEALGHRDEDGTIAVGSDGCEIDDDLRDEFDELIPISRSAERRSERRHAPFGLPEIAEDNGLEFLLHHKEYVLVYNADLRVPMVATYRLDRRDVVDGDRKDCFREDHRLEHVDRSRADDYDEPIFDRGHLVPVGDMHRKFSTSVNTFYYSNMLPQSGSLNSGVWRFLEGSTRKWAVDRDSIIVVSGAIFDRDGDNARDDEADAKRVRPNNRVGEPTGFYKIILHRQRNGDIDSMAFLLPHNFESIGRSLPYVRTKFATIDEIEAVSGYDFFSDLPNDVEAALESFKADDIWDRG